MKDTLSRPRPAISHQTEATFSQLLSAGQRRRCQLQVAQKERILLPRLEQGSDMLAWYYEKMSWCLRVYVSNGHRQVVLKDQLRGYFPGYDPAKQALRHATLINPFSAAAQLAGLSHQLPSAFPPRRAP